MKKALVSVLRLAMLVCVLILLPHLNRAQSGGGNCQNFGPTDYEVCPSCCSKTNSQGIPIVPFSNGPGIQSLQYQNWSCGTANAGGCDTACSGQTLVAMPDGSCCIKEGNNCSAAQPCCSGTVCHNTKCTACQTDCPYPLNGCIPCGSSPIILALNGGFQLTNAVNGVLFDISGTGNAVQMGWTAPGVDEGFLCLPDSNGRCDDGKDLFGNYTPQPPSATPNGFAALAVYDQPANGGNGDGIIDARDAVFNSLRLWIDANHDGMSQPDELYTLPSLGVNSISLNYKLDERTDQFGNRFQYRTQVNPGGPANVGRIAYDVFFVTLPN